MSYEQPGAMRFLHCSDVHITGNYSAHSLWGLGWRRWIAMLELRYGGRARAYRQARRSLSQLVQEFDQQKADHFILSGDLTAYALDEEFSGAHEALAPLVDDPVRCTVIPGNHDRYTPGSRHDARFERHFGHLLRSDLPEYCREGPYPFVRLLGSQVAVVGLNSARAPTIPGLSFGGIGAAQQQALASLLRDPRLDGRAVLVAVHHAPRTQSGRRDRALHGLWGGERLLGLLPGPRFAVLHGHIHRRYHHPATDRLPHLFCAGSSTQAGREGYWLIEVADGKVQSATKHGFSVGALPAGLEGGLAG
jgi:3',5'-cyclic AMP phosphodiesterase CpdA